MRPWIAAVSLLGLVTLGLATVPAMIDWNSYRSDIEAAATRLSGHEVTINGPIEVTFLPRPLLTLRDVSLHPDDDGPIGFSLLTNQADATLAVGPLLAGRPVVRDLRLRRPVLTIHGDGSRQLRTWPPRFQEFSAPLSKLDLNAISIDDGRIKLEDPRQGDRLAINDLSVQLRLDGTDGPLEVAGLFRTGGYLFIASASFTRPGPEGRSASKLTIEAKNDADETTTLRFNGSIDPSLENPLLRGRLALAGPDLQHGLAVLSTATGYPSTFDSIAAAQSFVIEGRIDADRRGMRSEDLQLRLSDRIGRMQLDLQLHPRLELDLDVDLPTLHLTDKAISADFLPLDLLSKLQVPPGAIDIELREVVYKEGQARRVRVQLETSQNGQTGVKQARAQLPGLVDLRFEGGVEAGHVGPRLKGRLSAVGDDLLSTLTWLDLVDAEQRQGGWRGLSLEADLDITSVEVALSNLDMRLDSSGLRGRTSLRFGERLRLALDVDVERPNLDLYLANGSPKDALLSFAKQIEGLDAEIAARFDRLIWQGVHIEEGAVAASLDQGQLTLDRMTARTVGETTLSLQGSIALDDDAAELHAELNSTYPARALNHLKLDLPLRSNRPRPVSLAGDLRGTRERFEIVLHADYDEGDAAIEGEAGWLADRFWYDLTIDAHHPDHVELASQFGLAPLVPTGDASGALELEGRLRHKMDMAWIASGSAKLGPTSLTGSLTFEGAPFESPFEARLSVGTPKRDSLTPLLILTGLRLAGDWTPDRWLGRLPAAGLRTAWLDKADGSLSLVSKGGLAGNGLTLDAKLTDGLLYVEKLEASPWQGALEAEFSFERRRDQPVAALALKLEKVELAEFNDWLGIKSGLKGPIDLRLEASSVGRTPYEMMAGLQGEIRIDAGPGELEGLGIPELRRTLLQGSEAGAAVDRSLSLPISEFDAEAALSRGIITFDQSRLTLDSASGTETEVVIDGTADLLLWIVDLTLTSKSAQGPDHVYRVVGPPSRPVGFASPEN